MHVDERCGVYFDCVVLLWESFLNGWFASFCSLVCCLLGFCLSCASCTASLLSRFRSSSSLIIASERFLLAVLLDLRWS